MTMELLAILFVAFMIAVPLGVIWFRSISKRCPDCAERVDKRASVCRSRYFVVGSSTWAPTTLADSKPGWTRSSAEKLRIISPAPTSSTSASATSAITSPPSTRRANGLAVVPVDSERSARRSVRAACRAGTVPNASATSSDAAAVNASMPASSCT